MQNAISALQISWRESLTARENDTKKKPYTHMTFPKKTMASYHTKTKQEERKKVENQPMHKSKTGERERKETCLSSCPHGPPSRSWWTCARSPTGVHRTRSCHRKLVLFSPYLDYSCFPLALCPWLSPCVCARAPRMPRTEYTKKTTTSRIQSLACVVGRRYRGKGTSRGTLSRAYVTRLGVRTLIWSLNRAPLG